MLRFVAIALMGMLISACSLIPTDSKSVYIDQVTEHNRAFSQIYKDVCTPAMKANGIPFYRAIYNPEVIAGLKDCVAKLGPHVDVLQKLKPPADYAEWHGRMIALNLDYYTYVAAIADGAERKDMAFLSELESHKPIPADISDFPWK